MDDQQQRSSSRQTKKPDYFGEFAPAKKGNNSKANQSQIEEISNDIGIESLPVQIPLPLTKPPTPTMTNESKSVISSATNASSKFTLRKREIELQTKKDVEQFEEEKAELQHRSEMMQIELKAGEMHLKALRKELKETPDEEEIKRKDLDRTIKAASDELEEKRLEFERFESNMIYRLKYIKRNREITLQTNYVELEKISVEEIEEQGNRLKITSDEILNEKERCKDWVLAQKILQDDVHIIQQQQEDEKKALERAKQVEAELANLEAEETLQQDAFIKAKLSRETKRLQLAKEAKAVEDLLNGIKTPGVPVEQATTNNETMMCKLLEMQLKMMENGQPSARPSSSHFLARQSHAKDLPFFGGKPEEWPTFIAEFERSSSDCAFSNSENMSRLRKCLKGEAYRTVQCLMVAPENLDTVLKTLQERFGQSEHIIEAMINKAKSVQVIKEEKLETLIEFGNAVQNVTTSINALKCEEHLSNPQLLRELEVKLPVSMRMGWMRWLEGDSNRKKNLSFFSKWLSKETSIACRLCPPKTETTEPKQTEFTRKRRPQDTVMATSANSDKSDKRNNYKNSSKEPWKARERKCSFCSNIGHRIGECKEFEKVELNDRWKLVREKKLCFYCLIYGHDLKVCRSKKLCGIDNCEKIHHRLLHQLAIVSAIEDNSDSSGSKVDAFIGSAQKQQNTYGLDSRINVQILPVRLQGPTGIIRTYAMLDGGANITLIQSDLADQLGLKGPIKPLRFQGLHPIAEERDSRSVKLNIMPATGSEIYGMSNVRTIRHMPLPHQSIRRKSLVKWKHLRGLGIQTYEGAQPKILIGNDHLKIMVTREVKEGPPNSPVGIRTNLGWTLLNPSNVPDKAHYSFLCQELDELHQMVKKYFTTESFGVKVCKELPRSKDDKRAQEIMDQTMKRVGNGKRWETGLLWKADDVKLPESRSMALNRLSSIERKIDRDPNFKSQYLEKMQHYLDAGFAKKLTPTEAINEGPRTWYLPHFATFKPSKPNKIRLVFDAAAKSHGISLNDTLLKGPDQMNPLPAVLYKFRQKAIGITGDIREMFHQVNIREEDKKSLRFLWRGSDRDIEPDTYEMQVMVFGAACSPACAQEAKNRNAKEKLEEFPEAANAIIYKHFVDDYLDSFDTEKDASRIVKEVCHIHLDGGFEIVNFISNSKEVMEKLPVELQAAKPKIIDPESSKMERVLGLNWNPETDNFSFTTNFHRVAKEVITGERIPTKREALSLIMSIYDPLGFLAHFTIKARILLQETWRSEIGWDDELPSSTHEKWIKWIEELQCIPTFQLPRCYHYEFSSSPSVQLHIFCDASQQAFSTVAYFRIATKYGIRVAYVSAKARVAPLKSLCMPRMELQAAVLGTRLAASIKEQHEIQPKETHYWTDSEVAYCWIRSDGNRCPQFVSHRIGEIQEMTDTKEWHWVPTKENVADEATRDNKPCLWEPESRWLRGPPFLQLPDNEWPKKLTKTIFEEVDHDQLEFKKQFVGNIIVKQKIIDDSKYSSWNKLRRITGWIFRFVNNCRSKKSERNLTTLLPSHMKQSDRWLWIQSQEESFNEEKSRLVTGAELSKNSRLTNLSPYLDDKGVMRLKGRLDLATNVSKDVKNPVILDPKHNITRLIIHHYHDLAGHQGQERVVNELRQLYYILNIRTAVKSAWHHCQECKNARALPVTPQMGLLPECRLQSYVRPFTVTGLDYFGPMEVTVGRRHEKRYGALFTCMTSRAVHVEIASSLTTDSCIMAIRRFASRRGCPQKIHSDNGTNFHGADNELKAALKAMDQEQIQDKMTNLGIEWHFNPPAAPHMGGSWERLVKSIKTALYATLKCRHPKEELLHTLMAEAEHVVNSRPLTHVSYDNNDEEALTPNHFLIGCSSNMQPPGDFNEKDICMRSQWRAAEALANQFWRRWVKEYLPCLTRRTKWHKQTKPIRIGDVCLIVDNNMTRNSWPKGLVVATYPGRDGLVRVVDVKTATGTIYKRIVAKICVLDVRENPENTAASSSGGSMSSSTMNKV